ncbi:MAG: hypothetical protein CVT99_01770 [Bacteroidetes bacterium HGW-Bacteroidetes-16]|jgi:hypothetical protein|nr:MAG: hypothetical protein CVT99_01770 [Bacteroidetes bacterium HGW-Bacteroidetes-16]
MKNMNPKNDQIVTVHSNRNNIHDIEQFAETLCDHLMINETYFGNILTSLSELYHIWNISNPSDSIKLSYNTDFKTLNIFIDGFEQKVIDQINTPENLDHEEHGTISDKVFVIQRLTDSIVINEDNSVQISFDISAIHNRIYHERARLLRAYHNGVNVTKVASNDDHV